MDTPKSYEDLQAEAEEIQKEMDRRRAVIDETGAPVTDTKTEPTPNLPTKEPPWEHDTIDYLDETWEVKKPQPQALAAFALASGKYITPEMQNDMVGLFIRNHMSDKSHRRAYERMMDPDDTFTQESMGKLMQLIATLGTGRPTAPSSP